MNRDEARKVVWEALRKVAKPDSRFHWNFSEFIADYEGSDRCAQIIREQKQYQQSPVIFVTPDNNMKKLREYVLQDNKVLLMTTYGICRGFQVVRPGTVPAGKEEVASTLDGIEDYMSPITLQEMKDEFGQVDLLVTGASAITPSGIRFGKGHGFFDLEWAMLWETGLVDMDTTVYAVGHDCQVIDADIEPSPYDTIVDYIVTPSGIRKALLNQSKPTVGVIWEKLEEGMLENIPPLQELYDLNKKGE